MFKLTSIMLKLSTLKSSKSSKGFTLIELLVVIGIIGTLGAVALVAINPAEAQRKARDTQRIKDMATLQSIVEQYLNDNRGAIAMTNQNSSGVTTTVSSCGSAGWLSAALGTSVSLCPYVNVVPVVPVNRSTIVTNSLGSAASKDAYYYFRTGTGTTAGAYKICTYLESAANKDKLVNDGESSGNLIGINVLSVFTSDSIICP